MSSRRNRPTDSTAVAHECCAERLLEIAALNSKLKAVATLEDLRQAVRTTDNYVFDPNNKPDYFLIRYDRAQNLVSVRPQYGTLFAIDSYDRAESIDPDSTNSGFNTVLVEVDEIESLKAAYPNYFGDVELFKTKLIELVGAEPEEFALVPQPTAPKKPRVQPDYSWLHAYKRWK